MEFLNTIKEQIPDYAKDIRLNIDGVIARSSLAPEDALGVALAAAFAAKSKPLVDVWRANTPAAEANAAKYLGAEAGYKACETAMMSMGRYGYAKEYHVERYLREVMICRIAPVSPQMILNYIAERVLGLFMS